jgi:L-iditol 2-dehydrogenase
MVIDTQLGPIDRTLAAVITAPRKVELVELRLPPLAQDRVLVQVTENGICASDVAVYNGKAPDRFPMFVGHEFGGTVVATGDGVTRVKVGDRVAVWTPGDEGAGTFGLATYAVVKAANCVKVGRYDAVATIEPLACCINAVDLAAPPIGAHTVIIGGGYMAQVLTALSPLAATVTVAARRRYQLDMARQMGATHVVALDARDEAGNAELLRRGVRRITGGAAAVAYETTGSADGVHYAATVLRNRGTFVDVGYHQGDRQAIDLGLINGKGLRFVNAHFRPDEESGFNPNLAGFHKAVRLVAGRLGNSLAQLVTHRVGLRDVAAAFATVSGRPNGHLKTVFDLRRTR